MQSPAGEVFLALLERADGESHFIPIWAALTRAVKTSCDLTEPLAELERLKHLAKRSPTDPKVSIYERLQHLNEFFSHVAGFCGNREAYADPANSFFDDVLEKRRGIPITLSLLFMEFGKAAGLTLDPIGFPAHFLVQERTEKILCDPYNARVGLEKTDCLAIAEQVLGKRILWDNRYLAIPSKTEVFLRMLNNLKNSLTIHNDAERLAIVVELQQRVQQLQMYPVTSSLH